MKFCLDRIEEGIAVCFSEDPATEGKEYHFRLDKNEALRTAEDGTIFTGTPTESGDVLTDVCLLIEETEERRARAKSRLSALFNRRK